MAIEAMHPAYRVLSQAHVRIVVAVWLVFTLLTLIHALETVDREPNREWTIAVTTLSTPTGPMIGAISRHGESGCLAFSVSLLPVCGGAFVLALAAQWLLPRTTAWMQSTRLVVWTGGWFTWFLGGLLSLLNALS